MNVPTVTDGMVTMPKAEFEELLERVAEREVVRQRSVAEDDVDLARGGQVARPSSRRRQQGDERPARREQRHVVGAVAQEGEPALVEHHHIKGLAINLPGQARAAGGVRHVQLEGGGPELAEPGQAAVVPGCGHDAVTRFAVLSNQLQADAARGASDEHDAGVAVQGESSAGVYQAANVAGLLRADKCLS